MTQQSITDRVLQRAIDHDLSSAGQDLLMSFLDGAPRKNQQPDQPYFLSEIMVRGFRGIGPGKSISFPPRPGLQLVVGRNGCGKSSFVDALELLISNKVTRFSGTRTKVWSGAWRNLHIDSPRLRATLESDSKLSLTAEWKPGAEWDQADTTRPESWDAITETHHPLLTYGEISAALSGKDKDLHTALTSALGLGVLNTAKEKATENGKAVRREKKDLKGLKDAVMAALQKSEDPRARGIAALVGDRKHQAEQFEDVILEQGSAFEPEALQELRNRAHWKRPTIEPDDLAIALMEAVENLAQTVETAQLEAIQAALAVDLDTCPVCDSNIDWRTRAREKLQELSTIAGTQKTAQAAWKHAQDGARTWALGLPNRRQEVAQLQALPEQATAWSSHLQRHGEAALQALEADAAEAVAELAALNSEWMPVHTALSAYHEALANWEATEVERDAILEVEKFLKTAESDLREQAFAPIGDAAREIWGELRHQSNVELTSVSVGGSRPKVDLDVSVDGKPCQALGVVSQGELMAMALSLFIPRLTQEGSPFKFFVLDDPVQAMDPAKVDGLARVLANAAQTHQVIVFTHDERLPAATRRLGLNAHIQRITRRADSKIDISPETSPSARALEEAHALVHSEEQLSTSVARLAVASLCRSAIESALVDRAWRTWHGPHPELERALDQVHSTSQLAAIALFQSPDQGAKVMGWFNARSPILASTFKAVRSGSHGEWPHGTNLRQLIRNAEALVQAVQR